MSQSRFSNIRVAVVGAGLMGRWHAHAASRLGARLVAVVDSSRAAAEALAKKHRGASAYTDIRELPDSEALGALHICTPPGSHYELVDFALGKGVSVLVEKPVTAAAEQTEALLRKAESHGVVLCPVHQFGFQRGVEKARDAIGGLGEVLRVSFRAHSAGAAGGDAVGADQVVADILPHPLALLQRLLPDHPLQAAAWQTLQARPGELQVSGRIGDLGVGIDISMNARPTRCEMELCCTGGRIVLNLFHGYARVERGRTGRLQKILQPLMSSGAELSVSIANLLRRAVDREPAYPGLRNLVGAFYAAVQDKTPPPVTPAEVLLLAQVRDQLISSGLPALRRQEAAAHA